MLRSFSVVGALAAAALALVIGILAFNSHQNQQHQPPGGPSQSGIADHPVAAKPATPQGGRPLLAGGSAPAPVQESRAVAGGSSFTSSPAVGGFSGAFAASVAAPPQPVSCNRGLLGGLVAVLGGLLGGGGGGC